MENYKHVVSALSICPIDFGFSDEEYKQRFMNFLIESGSNYTNLIKTSIEHAIRDPNWSWKRAAKDADFYAYDEKLSEEELFGRIKWLMWDVLFPDDNN